LNIKSQVKKIIQKTLPDFVLNNSLVSSFRQKRKSFFITVVDDIAESNFLLLLRDDSYMEKLIHQEGLYSSWEKESLKIWAYLSKNANTIIDIGANTGIYSLVASNNNPDATIVAIEPVPINFSVLKENIKKNKRSISAVNKALSDKNGYAEMFMLKNRLNYMTSVNQDRYALHPEVKGGYEVVKINVPTVCFSNLFYKCELSGLDLIKIDVEGHECTILEDMLPFISKFRPVILLEVIGGVNAQKLNKLFQLLNYSYISINETGKSFLVDKLWDNDHQNFLLCSLHHVNLLRSKGLIQ